MAANTEDAEPWPEAAISDFDVEAAQDCGHWKADHGLCLDDGRLGGWFGCRPLDQARPYGCNQLIISHGNRLGVDADMRCQTFADGVQQEASVGIGASWARR
ncbi:hypothetical protein [Actinospica robiniae]|uniref:hypothetical protein n=1 Tax=Actinospica robiniae TaxID=304901 RepID=UPI0012F7E7D4|nr:hypothetical protein [Actinospica robiniae]